MNQLSSIKDEFSALEASTYFSFFGKLVSVAPTLSALEKVSKIALVDVSPNQFKRSSLESLPESTSVVVESGGIVDGVTFTVDGS